MRIVHDGEPTPLAIQVLTDEHYPRGESQAPRMVRPPEEVDPQLLSQELERSRESLERTRSSTAAIGGCAGRIRHQILGQLNASEWLRFARLHANHHLEILRDIERALGASAQA